MKSPSSPCGVLVSISVIRIRFTKDVHMIQSYKKDQHSTANVTCTNCFIIIIAEYKINKISLID